MKITCSRCGTGRAFLYSTTHVLKVINDGWGSFGSALYCPDCTKTWSERNKREMADAENTMDVIDGVYSRTRK